MKKLESNKSDNTEERANNNIEREKKIKSKQQKQKKKGKWIERGWKSRMYSHDDNFKNNSHDENSYKILALMTNVKLSSWLFFWLCPFWLTCCVRFKKKSRDRLLNF